MGKVGKSVAFGALALGGLLLVSIALGPSRDAVTSGCRQTVGMASVNVDAWRQISSVCTDAELQALTREFQERDISTTQIERSQAGG